jgi:hypothetical protein
MSRHVTGAAYRRARTCAHDRREIFTNIVRIRSERRPGRRLARPL